MIIVKILFLIVITSSYLFAQNYMDTIELAKIKKLVEKEELIAKAYKEYIKFKGAKPSSVDAIITAGFLQNFDKSNPLTGIDITLATEDDRMDENIHKEIVSKSFLYDYYFSSSNRDYTKPPLSKQAEILYINLSSHEKYILNHTDEITTNDSDKNDKLYLDSDGILHWYDSSNKYGFSFGKDMIVDKSIPVLDDDGDISSEFKNIIDTFGIPYVGQTILHIVDGVAKEYLYLGELGGIIKVGSSFRELGKTIVQFHKNSGSAIINGDIYSWGNNGNRITTIDKDSYTKENSSASNTDKYPVITTLVKSKIKTYDIRYDDANVSLNDYNYYSSPLRPKFIDLFSSVYHGTCATSTKGELYCGGSTTEIDNDYNGLFTNITPDINKEVLYRSDFFDGSSGKKAVKIIAMNGLWLILANANNDEDSYRDGEIYRWGQDYAGFSGDSSFSSIPFLSKKMTYNNSENPTKLVITDGSSEVLFRDLTYLINEDAISYRKVGALSNEGNIWIWGLDSYYKKKCEQNVGEEHINLCEPYKVISNHHFISIQGGVEGFVAKDINGTYYRIRQEWEKLPQVTSINDLIKAHSDYVEVDDSEILGVDLSKKTDGSSDGIVWINGENELKGDYLTSTNENDDVFKTTISQIKWKKIKVLNNENSMCGIDIFNQMYCWGIVSSQEKGSSEEKKVANTFMVPVFNTNLFDLDKDYLVIEGGKNGYLTNMTSGEWSTTDSDGNTGAFFLKYPTYIGGFNYEFTFK